MKLYDSLDLAQIIEATALKLSDGQAVIAADLAEGGEIIKAIKDAIFHCQARIFSENVEERIQKHEDMIAFNKSSLASKGNNSKEYFLVNILESSLEMDRRVLARLGTLGQPDGAALEAALAGVAALVDVSPEEKRRYEQALKYTLVEYNVLARIGALGCNFGALQTLATADLERNFVILTNARDAFGRGELNPPMNAEEAASYRDSLEKNIADTQRFIHQRAQARVDAIVLSRGPTLTDLQNDINALQQASRAFNESDNSFGMGPQEAAYFRGLIDPKIQAMNEELQDRKAQESNAEDVQAAALVRFNAEIAPRLNADKNMAAFQENFKVLDAVWRAGVTGDYKELLNKQFFALSSEVIGVAFNRIASQNGVEIGPMLEPEAIAHNSEALINILATLEAEASEFGFDGDTAGFFKWCLGRFREDVDARVDRASELIIASIKENLPVDCNNHDAAYEVFANAKFEAPANQVQRNVNAWIEHSLESVYQGINARVQELLSQSGMAQEQIDSMQDDNARHIALSAEIARHQEQAGETARRMVVALRASLETVNAKLNTAADEFFIKRGIVAPSQAMLAEDQGAAEAYRLALEGVIPGLEGESSPLNDIIIIKANSGLRSLGETQAERVLREIVPPVEAVSLFARLRSIEETSRAFAANRELPQAGVPTLVTPQAQRAFAEQLAAQQPADTQRVDAMKQERRNRFK